MPSAGTRAIVRPVLVRLGPTGYVVPRPGGTSRNSRSALGLSCTGPVASWRGLDDLEQRRLRRLGLLEHVEVADVCFERVMSVGRGE